MEEMQIIRPGANGAGQSLQRVGFGEKSIETRRETQGSALAERQKAEVQARYIVAFERPRLYDHVRVRLLAHCARPGFAETAEYAKPVGGKSIRGASIRFVETALQEWGNVMPDIMVTYDDNEKRITRVALTDLERNITYSDDAIVEKFVERRIAKKGDEIISQRENSYGDTVYRIVATEDDVANKCASAVSKKLRNLGLRILPADLVDECMDMCHATRANANAKDPSSSRKKLVDALAAIGVMPIVIADYLGHPIDQSSPAEIEELRVAYATVRDGEARWIDLVELQREKRGEVEQVSKAASAASASMEAVKAKLEAKKKKSVVISSTATVAVEDMGHLIPSSTLEFTDDHANAIESIEAADSLRALQALHKRLEFLPGEMRAEVKAKLEARAEVLRKS